MSNKHSNKKEISPIKELAKLHWFSERLVREVLLEFYIRYYDTGGPRIEIQVEKYLDDMFDRKPEVIKPKGNNQ